MARAYAPANPRSGRVDLHDVREQLQRLLLRTLEGVAPHDGPEGAAVLDPLDLLQDVLRALRLAAREDHDAAAAERALHHVADAVGQRLDRDVVLLVDLLGLRVLDELLRRLDLDDVRPHLRRDLRGVGANVDGGLAFLRDAAAARIAPHDDREPGLLRLERELTELLELRVPGVGAGVDRVADRDAAEADRVLHGRRHGGDRRATELRQRVRVVELEDERHLPRELGRARLEEAERRSVRVAARVDRELEVVARIVAVRVRGERARGAVLEALVDGQDDELASARQATVREQARDVGERARAVGGIPRQDLLHAVGHFGFHRVSVGEGVGTTRRDRRTSSTRRMYILTTNPPSREVFMARGTGEPLGAPLAGRVSDLTRRARDGGSGGGLRARRDQLPEIAPRSRLSEPDRRPARVRRGGRALRDGNEGRPPP